MREVPWPRVVRSVRVRTTLAAMLATAVAVAAAGWLLVRQVEDTQLGQLADRAEHGVDEVAQKLSLGVDPQQAVDEVAPGVLVSVVDEQGCPVADRGEAIVTRSSEAAQGPPGQGSSGAADTGANTGGETLGEDDGAPGLPDPEDVLAGGGGVLSAGQSWAEELPAACRPPAGDAADHLEFRLDLVGPTVISSQPLERVFREVDTPGGTLTVWAAAPVDEVERSVAAVRRALWWGLPSLVLVVGLVTWRLVGRALRPVEAIRAEVEAIGGTTMHRRVPEPGSQDEVARLARTMNQMLGRLEVSARRQRQFVSDASHELRSPVAAIRTELEVALVEGEAADWPVVARTALGEEARLERLIDDLLVLAASDEVRPPPPAPVDLAALAAEEASRPRRVPVTAAAPDEPVLVAGDAGQLRRVLANLVDNAARHAHAAVTVAVGPDGDGGVEITVDDDGDGIAPEDRERVFARFTRLDEGRARDRGGSGLGLAVVRSLVRRHGGTVHAEASPTGGARLVVRLPAAAGHASRPGRNGRAPTTRDRPAAGAGQG
jgi:signal transduction histidine kinase